MGMNAWCCRGLCQRLCHVGAIGCVSMPADVLVDGGMSAHHMLEDVLEDVDCTGGCTSGCLVITL